MGPGIPILKFAAYVPAWVVILVSLDWLYEHLHGLGLTNNRNAFYSRPPLTEFVFLLLGLVGILVVSNANKVAPYFRTFVLAAVVTLISFGGWWWTEIMYDNQVIHSKPTLGQ